jgi:hypothetical protein
MPWIILIVLAGLVTTLATPERRSRVEARRYLYKLVDDEPDPDKKRQLRETVDKLIAERERNTGPGRLIPLAPVPPEFWDPPGGDAASLTGKVTHVQDVDPQTGVQGELVQISPGLDAGLARGAVLNLYREVGKEWKQLGTVTIDTVYPKYAVGVFRPADANKPLRRLKPDEFPKIGDVVRTKGRDEKPKDKRDPAGDK